MKVQKHTKQTFKKIHPLRNVAVVNPLVRKLPKYFGCEVDFGVPLQAFARFACFSFKGPLRREPTFHSVFHPSRAWLQRASVDPLQGAVGAVLVEFVSAVAVEEAAAAGSVVVRVPVLRPVTPRREQAGGR